MIALTTDRLRLDPVRIENARALWAVLQQPSLREFQDIPRTSFEEFERQVRARPTSLAGRLVGRFEWLILERSSMAAAGWVSLRVHDRSPGSGEIGYSLLEAFRGRGYATEALRGVLDETFRQSELNELHAACVPANLRSRAVLDRVGFREVRTMQNGALVRGRRVDVVTYEIMRSEWRRMVSR